MADQSQSDASGPDRSRPTQLLGASYGSLYGDYYASGDVAEKRGIAARQSREHVVDALAGRRPTRLIDVGAGEGSLLAELAAAGVGAELHAVEISESGLAAINARTISRLHLAQRFDGYHIPYPDKHFDVALAFHVLEHVEHERLFLREVARVADELIIEVPIEHGLRVERSIAIGRRFGHINFYTPATFRSLLESAGLRVLSLRVCAPNVEYERYLSGKLRGSIKHMLRSRFLAWMPRVAVQAFTYLAYARCRAADAPEPTQTAL